jgi:GT2 family glycosyltransferase/peptidoglycan/xylan/chitin deacetylase (PgdA/CDA1 family)
LTRLSVVIPTFQRRETVRRTVAALDRQTLRDFEVIVSVDGSTDGTAAALRDLRVGFPLAVIEQLNRGRAAAVDAGATVAEGELLLFLDDDMEADPALLAEHDRSHREGADVVMGDLPLDPTSPPNMLSWGVGWWARARCERLTAPGAEIRLDDLLTGQMSLPREVYEAVGGFDSSFTREGLFGGEDIDLGYRLVKAGYEVTFNPTAISYQYYDVGPAEYLKRAREAGRSDWELLSKHPELASRLGASPSFTTRRSSLFLSPFVAAPAWLSGPLRAAAAAIVSSGRNTPRVRRLFFSVRTLEYLRGRRAARRGSTGGTALVLAYHAISDLSADPVLAEYGIAGETLAAQLDMLSERGHRFVELDSILAGLDGTAPLPAGATLVTFDDAYADLLPEAAEILAARGIPAVVFAVSGQIGGTNEWDRHLGAAHLPLLDAGGLRALIDSGFEVGAHGVSHRPLTKLTASEVAAELRDSADQIESAGLPRPRAFAYPHGEWDGGIAASAAEAGYAASFTIDPGLVCQGLDAQSLPRVEVLASDSQRALRVKIATVAWPKRWRDRLLRLLGTKS